MIVLRLKALVLADIHGASLRHQQVIEYSNPDLIIIPGDIPSSFDIPTLVSGFMTGRDRSTYLRTTYEKFSERIVTRQIRTAKRIILDLLEADLPILIIHGNTETDSTRYWLSLFSHRYPNLHWISDDFIEFNDILFLGHGWVPRTDMSRYPTPGEIASDLSKKVLLDTIGRSDHSSNKKILISHSPPFHTSLDRLRFSGKHVGSGPVREVMDSGFFDGVISGHIHESMGSMISKTHGWWGVNAGAVVEDRACLIDFDSMKVTWLKKIINPLRLETLIYKNRSRVRYS